MTFDASAHYPLDPKKIRAEGSMHKATTWQGSDRQDFYRHGKKLKNDEINADLDWVCHRQPSNKDLTRFRQSLSPERHNRASKRKAPLAGWAISQ